jgi:hypothetical protein
MSEQPQTVTRSGPPAWTYALGAVVGAAGLAWTVASHFIPKAEGSKTTAEAAAPAVTPPASAGNAAVSQNARAGDGGTAINASGNAQVHVGKP